MPLTRRERTTMLTALAVSWLWEKRRCRMIGLEVGFDRRGAGTPWDRLRRADVMGAHALDTADRRGQVWTFEVKSTTADWSREDLAVGKWTWDLQVWCRPVVLCWDVAMAHRVAADLGARPWSVAYPDAAWRSLKWLGSRAEPSPPAVEGDHWRNVAVAVASVHTSQFMPSFANAQRNPVPLPRRVAEKLEALRDNKEQLDLFLDRVEE